VLKTLHHPNIIHLEDVFEDETHIYMVRGGKKQALTDRVTRAHLCCAVLCSSASSPFRSWSWRGEGSSSTTSWTGGAFATHTHPEAPAHRMPTPRPPLPLPPPSTLSEEEAADLVRRLASAIAYMHSMEIIHRDLKPGACRAAFQTRGHGGHAGLLTHPLMHPTPSAPQRTSS
jgi:serine/threonine protein kinase